jgi:hypothetical protein
MTAATLPPPGNAYELRFESLFQPGPALAFPCDSEGHVDLERCSPDARTSYLFARFMVGREYKRPRVAPAGDPQAVAAGSDAPLAARAAGR